MSSIGIILLSFVLILLLLRLKLPLFICLVLGTLLLSLISQMPASLILSSLSSSLLGKQTISLLLIIALITIFAGQLKASGKLRAMVESARSLVTSRRARLILFPALIGLLPMPGGAVFSAPMVDEAGKDVHLSPSQLTAINYWFRHIWEYWWPLYPGVLLTVSLTKLSLAGYVASAFPLSIVAILVGVFTLFKGLGRKQTEPATVTSKMEVSGDRRETKQGRNSKDKPTCQHKGQLRVPMFFIYSLPVMIVVIGGIVLDFFREYLVDAGYPMPVDFPRLGIIVSLLGVIIWLGFLDLRALMDSLRGWMKLANIEILLAVGASLWYKNMLISSGLGEAAVKELLDSSIPAYLIILLLPLFAGIMTGIQVAAIGVSMPIVIGIAGLSALPMVSVAVLAYASAFMGVMLSPIHFCLILSKEYFRANYTKVYILIFPSVVVVLLSGWLLASFLSLL